MNNYPSLNFGQTPIRKRTLGIRDKHIIYDIAKHRCQNPYCKKLLSSEAEMQIGHKQAYSRRGDTTISNSVCLCYACNRKQGTDSWETFLKKQEKATQQAKPKEKIITKKVVLERKTSHKTRQSSPYEIDNSLGKMSENLGRELRKITSGF